MLLTFNFNYRKKIMDLKNKKIGIWGFGVVGKSVTKYFVNKLLNTPEFEQKSPINTKISQIQVLDKRELTEQEKTYLGDNKITFVNQGDNKDFENFLENNDFIVTSAGIDLRNYKKYSHKFISELDIFFKEFSSCPIIGITGTVGKTTITHMLDQIIKHQNINIWTGGNIGAGVLDVLENNLSPDLILLELSSFQLELCKTFAPDLAIWTNFFPNHLDKHSNMQEYFMAKMQILAHQTTDQFALLPISLIDQLKPFIQTQITRKESPFASSTSNTDTSITNTSTTNPIQIKSKLYFFSENKPTQELIDKLRPQDALLYLDHSDPNTVIKLSQKQDVSNNQQNSNTETIGSIEQIDKLAEFTFRENLLIIFGSLYIFSKIVNKTLALSDARHTKITNSMHKYIKNNITPNLAKLADPNTINLLNIDPLACQVEHRLEKVASIDGIEFYNDSKATTISSTIAAVQKLASKNKPIILILGGLSKGVDRSPMISEIKKYVKLVISFGKEAETIKNMCEQVNLPCQSIENLDKLILKSSPEKPALGKLLLELTVKASFSAAQPNDQILLSPSGSSYDLFKDYQERGRIFKQIVLGFTEKTVLKQ